MSTLYTIGHSTRTLSEMLDVLHFHSVSTLVDIRAFPRSRRLPHFNRETLEKALPTAGMRYVWLKELGGYRKKQRDDSPNLALRNASFRNYADYMLSPEFGGAVAQLVQIAEESRTAYMCAERVWFHCHRRVPATPGKHRYAVHSGWTRCPSPSAEHACNLSAFAIEPERPPHLRNLHWRVYIGRDGDAR